MQITFEALFPPLKKLNICKMQKGRRAEQYPSKPFSLTTVVLNFATCLRGRGTHLPQYIIPGTAYK